MGQMVDNPMYATGVWLVLHGARHRSPGRLSSSLDGAGSVLGRVRYWLRAFATGA